MPRKRKGYYDYYLIEDNRSIGGKQDYLLSFRREEPRFYYPHVYDRIGCERILKDLSEQSIDLIIDDLPYGLTQTEWDIQLDWDELAELYDRSLKPRGLIYIFGKQPMLDMIWNKDLLKALGEE